MPPAREKEEAEGHIVTPRPDPTVLTTQQLLREVAMLRELLETRLGGMDKAIELVRLDTAKSPAFVADQIHQLQALHEEKFRSVAVQFVERDIRSEQTSRDSKVAVDAALQAAKEAVGEQNKSNSLSNAKMETAVTKQIDALVVLIQSQSKAMDEMKNGLLTLMQSLGKATDEKIDDVKGRITIIESRAKGLGDGWGYLLATIGAVIGIVTVIMVATKH